MKDPLKKYIQDNREEFDTLEVPDEMFGKIMSKLNEPNISEDRKIIPLFEWKKWVAAASVVLIFSFGFYTLWNQNKSEKTIVATQEKVKTSDENLIDILNQKKEFKTAKIETTKQETVSESFVSKHLVSSKKIVEVQSLAKNNNLKKENNFDKSKALELLDNQYSASSRLQGIALLKDFSVSDEQLIKVLSERALSDENTNVRLAAVETLSAHIENPEVGKNIRQIFLQQDDAMVQKELIAILGKQNSAELNAEVNAKLKELALNPTTVAFVKDEAYAVLMKY